MRVEPVRCQRCNETLDCKSDNLGSLVGEAVAEHRQVCPKRPIGVGDYVRWERIHRNAWLEGEVVRVSPDGSNMHVNVAVFGGSLVGIRIGEVNPVDGTRWTESTSIRRIPRPVAAQDSPTAAPAPNIYADGLDLGGLSPIRCWMRWRDNHADLEHGAAPRWSMTDDQIASAKRIWHRLRSEQHAAELRRKVSASTAADRARAPRVVVERQDEP